MLALVRTRRKQGFCQRISVDFFYIFIKMSRSPCLIILSYIDYPIILLIHICVPTATHTVLCVRVQQTPVIVFVCIVAMYHLSFPLLSSVHY